MSSTTDTEQRFAYLLSPEFEIVNTAGKPLTGGWIEVYIHGTRDKYYCLSDFDGTLHPFQIPLDSLGSNIVLASPTHAYDIYIYNKFGSLVMSRYNVVPATNSPDAVADVVVIDSPDETINVTIDGGSNWHLEVNTDLIATASGLAEVSGALTEVSGALLNKKDKQEPVDVSGSVTKTVTNIKQNENGEIEVTYEDIDLPQQVPNVNIISPSGTLDITSTTDPATNTKTFKIDVHKSNMDYFEGYYGRAHYEDRPSDTTAAFTTYVDNWREYRYQGDFIANSWQDQDNTTFLLNSGLYLITASIRYKMADASVKNKEEYIRIATGAFNGLENGTQLKDWSNEAALDENTIQLSFVRSVDDDEDYDNLRGNHTLYFAPYLPYGVNYAEIDHLQIVKLDSIVTYHGGPGPSYKPGYGIEIQDNVISVATGDVVTNNYFETVVSSINTEINELTTVINNVSGDITNLNESVTNLIGATGDYATKDYVDEAVSGLENYSAGQYISIEDHVISVTGLQPEGDYATNADLQTVSAAIPESEEVEFEELDLSQFAQASAVTVIQNQITNVTGDIYNINEDITNLIGATGDYATEEYVNEAIAAVTGQPLTQQQSDWTQTDDTKVDYIKHKPRQVNLVAGDNITIEQDGLDVIISAEDPGDTYSAGQYISIQNNTIAATGLQPAGNYLTPADLNGYATEQYVDEAVAAVTGQPLEQVNSDWLATSGVAEILNKPDVFQLIAGDNIDITPSGNDLVISASSDVTKAYVDEQIDAVTGMIPTLPQEEEVEFEELNLSDYALASAIPDVSDFATKTELADAIAAATGMIPDVSNFATNDDVQYVQEQVDQLVAATGYYLQANDLNGYATEQDVDAAIDAATGMIPDVSNLATKSELAAVEAEIPTLPSEEEVEFEELNLSDYALASAIPDISNLATKTELQEVEAEIPDVSNLATKAEVQAATGMIPSLDGYATEQYVDDAIDTVTGMIPDVSNFVTQQDVDDSIAPVQSQIDTLAAATGDYLTEQVNADWNATSGVSEILNKPESEEVEFEELDLSVYALASAIPSLDGYATEAYVDAAITGIDVSDIFWAVIDSTTYAEIQAAKQAGKQVFVVGRYGGTIYVPTYSNGWVNADFGNPLHSEGGFPHLTRVWVDSSDVWHSELFIIPYRGTNGIVVDGGTISVTGFEQVNSDWNATSGVAEILNKPEIIEYELSEISAGEGISIVSGVNGITISATGCSYIAGQNITFTASGDDIVISSTAAELTGASGVKIEDDVASLDDPIFVKAGSGITITQDGDDIVISAQGGGSSYAAGAGIDITNDTISIDNTVALASALPTTEFGKFTIQSNVSGGPIEVLVPTDVGKPVYLVMVNNNAVSGTYGSSTSVVIVYRSPGYDDDTYNYTGGTVNLNVPEELTGIANINLIYSPNSNPISTNGPYLIQSWSAPDLSNYKVPVGNYSIPTQSNVGGSSYGKYLVLQANGPSPDLEQLSKITINAIESHPELGVSVNLDRYYLGNTNTTTSNSGTQALIYTDSNTKKQTVFMPTSMPSNWKSEFAQAFEYGSNRNSPDTSYYTTKQYRAYKYTSSPRRYQFAYCTDWDYAHSIMTFVAYDNSGNAIEKWTLDYSSYYSNVWTTTPITPDMSDYVAYSASGVSLPNSHFEIDTDGQAYKITNVSVEVNYNDHLNNAWGGIGFGYNTDYPAGTFEFRTTASNAVTLKLQPDVTEDWHGFPVEGIPFVNGVAKWQVPEAFNTGGNYLTCAMYDASNNLVSYTTNPRNLDLVYTGYIDKAEYALKSDIPVVTGYATTSDVNTAIASVEADIQTVSGAVDAVSGAIPESEEVEFEEVDLTDYALASAIPDVSNLATKNEVQLVEAEIQTVSGAIPTLADLNTQGITDIQVVQALPVSPVSTVLYLIPEA